jgi:hypothetical protein
MWVCVNRLGDSSRLEEGSVCSDHVTVYDEWHQFTLDVEAQSTQIDVLLYAADERQSRPSGHESRVLWDDAWLSVAPVSATPTPAPTPLPVRPAPVPFDGISLRDAMLDVRDNLQQMGGMLDRGSGSCEEYLGWYWNLVRSPIYAGVPVEWQWAHDEYIGAVEHAIEENREIKEFCDAGGGSLTQLVYGSARMAIDEAIARLGPAIDSANQLLGQ